MTLGERIAQYRKNQGISQEELGARLGVSRQAVSKWETGAAAPDMNNLMALAREFGISMAELTETPEGPPPEDASAPVSDPAVGRRRLFWPVLCGVLAAALVLMLVSAVVLLHLRAQRILPSEDAVADGPPSTAEQTSPVPYPATDFALLWTNSDGNEEFLELGAQEDFFPFGTSLELTEPEEVTDTDYSSMTRHRTDCGEVTIIYDHIEDEGGTRDVIVSLSTISSEIATSRGIIPKETKDDLLSMYGDELVYHFKEEDEYTLVPHNYYYVYSAYEDGIGWAAIRFFMKDGLVAGISIESLGELGDFYAPDGVSCFPLKDGEPDFSQRQEPEREDMDDTRRAYIAWNQLVTNNNLSAEERYACRRDVFGLLPYLDWGEFMTLGGTEYPEDTAFAFMDWLARQDSYSQGEMLSLQMGCTAKGLDGAYTDSYDAILSHAMFYDPASFTKALATDGVDEEVKWNAIMGTAYDADWYTVELDAAVNALDDAIDGGVFTEEQEGWAKLLRLYLLTPIDERPNLPKTPAELT